MTGTRSTQQTRSLLEELDELVDQSIESMSPAQLKKFRQDRRKIMASVSRHDAASHVPHESAVQEQRALRA